MKKLMMIAALMVVAVTANAQRSAGAQTLKPFVGFTKFSNHLTTFEPIVLLFENIALPTNFILFISIKRLNSSAEKARISLFVINIYEHPLL